MGRIVGYDALNYSLMNQHFDRTRKRYTKHFQQLTPVVMVCLLQLWNMLPALAEINYNHSATASTDYYIRGLTRSTNNPSIRYGGELQGESLFVGFNLVTANYPGIGPFADHSADFEYTLHAGYFGEISDSISWQGQFAYHEYVGGSFSGDYFEGSASLHLPFNISLTYLLTKNEHITDDFAQYVELNMFQPLSSYLVASGTFGIARTDTIVGSNYEYMDVGLSFLVKSFSLDFRQYLSFGHAGRLQPLADDHFVVSLTKSF